MLMLLTQTCGMYAPQIEAICIFLLSLCFCPISCEHVMNRRHFFPVLAALLAAAHLFSSSAFAQEGQKNVLPFRGEQPVRARHGMVVSVHRLASDAGVDRKSTRLNSSHLGISYA